MALVIGTNCGFVTTAPTSDPDGDNFWLDGNSLAIKDTSPATAAKIIEIGLYSHDSGSDIPQTRLNVDNSNAKGTTAGWKTVSVNWTIDANTIYWLAVQLDDTNSTNVDGDYGVSSRISKDGNSTGLITPWNSDYTYNNPIALYAVWEEAPTGTNIQVNVDDSLKDVATAYVNVDDSWKEVANAYCQVDDAWKTIF